MTITYPMTSINRFESEKKVKKKTYRNRIAKSVIHLPSYKKLPEDEIQAYSLYKNTPVLKHEYYSLNPDPILSKIKTCRVLLNEFYPKAEGASIRGPLRECIDSWLKRMNILLLDNTKQKADMTISIAVNGRPVGREYQSDGILYTGSKVSSNITISTKYTGEFLSKTSESGVNPPRWINYSVKKKDFLNKYRNPKNAPFFVFGGDIDLTIGIFFAKRQGVDSFINLIGLNKRVAELIRNKTLKGSRMVELLMTKLRSPQTLGHWYDLVSILADIGDCRAVELFMELLQDTAYSKIHHSIIKTLSDIYCPKTVVNMMDNCIKKIKDQTLITQLQKLKSKLLPKSPTKTKTVNWNKKYNNELYFSGVINYHGRIADKNSIKILEKILLSNFQNKLRIKAASKLGDIGKPHAVEALINGLISLNYFQNKPAGKENKHYRIWVAIVSALHKTHDFRAWQTLEAIINSSNEIKTINFLENLLKDY
jgi:HEAT repeat protein